MCRGGWDGGWHEAQQNGKRTVDENGKPNITNEMVEDCLMADHYGYRCAVCGSPPHPRTTHSGWPFKLLYILFSRVFFFYFSIMLTRIKSGSHGSLLADCWTGCVKEDIQMSERLKRHSNYILYSIRFTAPCTHTHHIRVEQ